MRRLLSMHRRLKTRQTVGCHRRPHHRVRAAADGRAVPAGTAPMQAAGPTVATSPTRPELAADVADGKYTIKKALAQGYLINNGTPPDGGAGR